LKGSKKNLGGVRISFKKTWENMARGGKRNVRVGKISVWGGNIKAVGKYLPTK